VGDDFAPYASRLERLGIPQTHLRQVAGQFTGQAFITTDLDDNQITAFHPGAMGHSHLNSVAMAQEVSLGIVSPDGREGMIQHALEFANLDIPFVFDPGQGMPMFSGAELLSFIDQASYVTVNDYEAKLLQDKTGKSLTQIAQRVKALIVTLGPDGSLIYADGKEIAIPTPKPSAIVDPTGCGDAYRAGLLHGIQLGWDWQTSGRLASLMGSLKIASRGGQNHKHSRAELADLYNQHFDIRITL
jgi:adenosine kinase